MILNTLRGLPKGNGSGFLMTNAQAGFSDQIAKQLNQLASMLREEQHPHALGQHSLLIPSYIAGASISVETKNSLKSRSINKNELSGVVWNALGIKLTKWYQSSLPINVEPYQQQFDALCGRRTPCKPVPWPAHWEGIEKDLIKKPDLWIEKGWQFCNRCLCVQPRFSQHSFPYGTPICGECVGSFRYQSRSTIRDWLTEWYLNRASDLRQQLLPRDRMPLANVRGLGEHDYQFDTFMSDEFHVACSYISKLFGHRCAYCGGSSKKVGCLFDHGIPRALGGHNVAENMILACASCNSSKGMKTVSQYYAFRRARRRPVVRSLERIALDLENSYNDMYSQFSEGDIINIKKPLLELLPFPAVGDKLTYDPAGFETAPDLAAPKPGARIIVVKQRSYSGAYSGRYECKVVEPDSGIEYWVNCQLLRR